MIFTDGTHLITNESIEELHKFARNIGLKKEWFQDKRMKYYDLTTKRMANRAINCGALKMSSKGLVMILLLKEMEPR